MKPSFALSLSFDGIRLLHRAAGGWRLVGDVALDAADMGRGLEDLRDRAEALEPGGLYTKLLLPNEQIKYLTIETPGATEVERERAAEAALDGATPYAVDDLAFDFSRDGDATHIAAVARETLIEAENFAVEHQFQPICFAAVPEDEAFLGEPFFGRTAAADTLLEDGDTVETDGIAVVVIGEAIFDDPDDVSSEEDASVDEGLEAAEPDDTDAVIETEEPVVADAVTEDRTVAETETEGVADTQASEEANLEPEPEPEPEPEQVAATVAAPQPETPETSEAPPLKPVNVGAIIDPDKTGESEATDPAPAIAAMPPLVGFASRRLAEKAKPPALAGATRTAPPKPPALSNAEAREPPAEPAPAPPEPAPKVIAQPIVAPAVTEQERMTIFGARQKEVGGKPKYLGLGLTAGLLVFLAGVAGWASVFLDDNNRFSRLFGERSAPEVAIAAPTAPVVQAEPEEEPAEAPVAVASLEPELTSEDTAVLDALSEPLQPEPPRAMTPAEIDAKYATDGIYPRAPVVPPEPAAQVDIEDLYLTSIDPVSTTSDAVALPPFALFQPDDSLAEVALPPPPGTRFSLDAEGRVIPTAAGALSPDGFTVFRGRPPLVPPAPPTRANAGPATSLEESIVQVALAAVRPQPRPSDLRQTVERAQLSGLTRSELAGYRPVERPQSVQEQAAASAPLPVAVDTDAAVTEALATPDPLASATRFATATSLRPDTRPKNFARSVQRAQRAAPQQETRVASAAAVAPRTVTPKIPTKASVAKAATDPNAINLRKVNLIGVYGKPSSRRALVRLSNGRYRKVEVGDRVDGGVVSAIGESELRYTKRGRNVVLKMPR